MRHDFTAVMPETGLIKFLGGVRPKPSDLICQIDDSEIRLRLLRTQLKVTLNAADADRLTDTYLNANVWPLIDAQVEASNRHSAYYEEIRDVVHAAVRVGAETLTDLAIAETHLSGARSTQSQVALRKLDKQLEIAQKSSKQVSEHDALVSQVAELTKKLSLFSSRAPSEAGRVTYYTVAGIHAAKGDIIYGFDYIS